MNNANWTLKNGLATIDCASFPYAFRTAFNIVRKTVEAKKDPGVVIKGILILGPPNARGERNKYTYAQATELAQGQGLLQPDGSINSREFKRRF
jgi:hypothetical protein